MSAFSKTLFLQVENLFTEFSFLCCLVPLLWFVCTVCDRFLYQVFPGTRRQCERLLHRAAREGEITAIEKLVRLKTFVGLH